MSIRLEINIRQRSVTVYTFDRTLDQEQAELLEPFLESTSGERIEHIEFDGLGTTITYWFAEEGEGE